MEYFTILMFIFALSRVHSQSAPECGTLATAADEKCCEMGSLYKTFGLDKEVNNCIDEMNLDRNALALDGTDPTSGCLTECLLSKAKFLTPDLVLNDVAIKENTRTSLTGSWADVGAKVIGKCLKTSVGKISKDAKCKSGSHQFMRCVFRGFFTACPKEIWTESGICKARRELLEKCVDSLPPALKRTN